MSSENWEERALKAEAELAASEKELDIKKVALDEARAEVERLNGHLDKTLQPWGHYGYCPHGKQQEFADRKDYIIREGDHRGE